MIETIDYAGKQWPLFQTKGFAAKFAFPFAEEVCKGTGYDIGCNRKEWSLPGSIPIDITFDNGFHATALPDEPVDYIFSSHCLEHLPDWTGVLNYWVNSIKPGGVIFLYLPDYSQEYWRPWSNRKHVNILTPKMLEDYFKFKGFAKIYVSGCDLYNSFSVMAQK